MLDGLFDSVGWELGAGLGVETALDVFDGLLDGIFYSVG